MINNGLYGTPRIAETLSVASLVDEKGRTMPGKDFGNLVIRCQKTTPQSLITNAAHHVLLNHKEKF